MGSGIENVGEASVAEKKDGVGVFEEEKAVLGSDGSNGAEFEDVFEEAMDSQEHLDEPGVELGSSDQDVMIGAVDGSDEVEVFEVATGVPFEKDVAVTAVEEKGDSVGGGGGGGEAEGGTRVEEVGSEANGGLEGARVISEVVVGGSIESLNGGDGVDNHVSEINDDDDDKVIFERGVTVEKLENEAVPNDSHRETESSKEILTQDCESQGLNETTLGCGGQNGSAESIMDSEDQDSIVGNGLIVASVNDSDVSSLKFEDDTSVQPDAKAVESGHLRLDNDIQKSCTENASSVHGADGVEPQNSDVHTVQNDGEVKDTSTRLTSEHSGETSHPKSTLADMQTTPEDKEVLLEAVIPPFSDNSTIEKIEVIQAGSSGSGTENNKVSQPEHVRDVHVVCDNGTNKEPEKNEEKSREITKLAPTPAKSTYPSLVPSPAPVLASAPAPISAPAPTPTPAKSSNPSPAPALNPAPTPAPALNPAPTPTKSTNLAPSPAPSPAPAPAPAPSLAGATNPPSPAISTNNPSITSSPARPAGLGRGAPLLEPASRFSQQHRVNGATSHTQNQQIEEPVSADSEEYDETREKLQMIRVKFLRLSHRLGQTPHNVVVAQVLYRLGLAEQLRGRNGGRVGEFSFDRASAKAEQLEASGQEPLDFSCTIMVLGKTGVGKSATINSIFDEVKFGTDAFHMGTKKVQDVVGTVQGIKVRVIDTPGLLPSWSDQRQNEKILQSVKSFINKTPPDIVLYLDRLDMQSRDFSDMPLLRTITATFGPSIWCNAIVVLTHAASAPPDGPNGTASSYDMFVTQRSHVVQQAIRQAAADMRLMNPVSLVENHSACRTNRAGQRVLPNGQVWKPHLLLLSFASKILAEANALLKLQDSPPGRPFATRSRSPPLPYLLSTLLQSRPQLKLPEDQFGNDDGLDDDLDEPLDSDEESEYDNLPPFMPLTKSQVANLSRAQKKAYFDEIEYREQVLMKKQLKEERKQRKMMKKMAAESNDLPSNFVGNLEEENQPSVPMVPMPDLALPASFDSDSPTHRYRFLDTSSKWLVRPVLDNHGWDHDVGYEGLNVDRLFVVKNKVPLSVSGQVTKDKKDSNLQMEVSSSIKHGEGKATSLGFDLQTVGKDLAYTLRSETRFSNYRRNKATAGISATLLGDTLSGGVKVEDKLVANKRFEVVMTGGAMMGRGEVAYGGSLEAQLRDKDHPFGRSLSTLGLSVMDWHGDLAIGCNVQSQIPVGRHSNLVARANLNNRGSGQVSLRLNSSEQLQIALVALIPIMKRLLLTYPQHFQFGQ